jgi:hypothetical protein
MSKLPVALAAVLLITGFSGYAIAQSGSPTPKKIKACAKKKGGALRLSGKKCRRGERRVTWAARGPQGLAGASGQAGAPGTPGANGTNGTNGTDGTSTGETFFASQGFGSNFGFTPCDGTPAGPSVTVDVPSGSYVQVLASATMQRSGGATSNTACIRVDGDDTQFAASTSLSAETRYLQSGTPGGVTSKYAARPLTFPLDAGSHTISMRYGSVGGTSNFTNRNLYVTVFHPTAP